MSLQHALADMMGSIKKKRAPLNTGPVFLLRRLVGD